MRTYSLIDLSSAFASLAKAINSDGGTRSFNSSVHFSFMGTQQKRAGADIAVRPVTSAARMTALRGVRREKQAGMSGCLLVVFIGKQIRTQQAQVHQASGWNAVLTPLRDGSFRDFTQASHLNGASERVDNLVRFVVHVASIDIYTNKMQHPKQKNV